MSDDSIKREIDHLMRVKRMLDADRQMPLRLDIRQEGLSGRKLNISISGIRGLVADPQQSPSPVRAYFQVSLEIPPGYPHTAIPVIKFVNPVPFHPHIYTHGGICWGTSNAPQPSLWLADWVRLLIEYLQYNQDPTVMLKLNSASPANSTALAWWSSHGRDLPRYVPRVDLPRLQTLINRARV